MTRVIACLSAVVVFFAYVQTGTAETIRCASTTSTQNSGLFDYLLPMVKADTGIEVQVIAVGTGAALALGKRGDVDLVFVHAREAELKMVEEGWFVERREVMYNDFVMVGPLADPAGLKGARSADEAFGKIQAAATLFISRGDDSGTHQKELKLWQGAGAAPDAARDKWYLSVGQGMAKTIRIAAEKQAYTLTDRGTWLSLKDRDDLGLTLIFEGDPKLFNQYGVMLVNPAKHPQVRSEDSRKFIAWLVSEKGQQTINSYQDTNGNRLFIANAE